ncbi:MAG: cytochrome c biogenesis protein ResB [Desulfobacteraceae bacterium]
MAHDKSESSFLKRIWNFFTSVKLTVVLLVLLAATSIIGTIIPQNASPAYYFHTYGESLYKLFAVLNVFDMYNSWWFLTLLGMLAVNIVVCSVDRLRSTWKIIFPEKILFKPQRYRKLKNKSVFETNENMDKVLPAFKGVLDKKFSFVSENRTDDGVALYAEKGRWTRLGVYVVHSSILLLLIGGLIGGVFGLSGNVRLDEGEKKDAITLSGKQQDHELGFFIKCNSFNVSFYDSGAPEEFRSNLSIIKDGEEVMKSDILVNHPLSFEGYNIYQSSYGTSSADKVLLQIQGSDSSMVYTRQIEKGEKIKLPEGRGTFELTGFEPNFNFRGHSVGEAFTGIMRKGEDPKGTQIVLPVRFPTFDKMRRGDIVFSVKDYEKTYYTGLQVAKDPGVPYVYVGFILMIAGCFITFFMSHQSVMVEVTSGNNPVCEVSVAGTANRNSQSMKLKIERLAIRLKESISS